MKRILETDLIFNTDNNELIAVNDGILSTINEVKKLFNTKNNNNENSGDNIVFFTGAGISTSTGIPDFKSQEENWNKDGFELSRSEVFSLPFFRENPERFWEIFRESFPDIDKVSPSLFHTFIASFNNAKIITQNVDNLHNVAFIRNKNNEGNVQNNQEIIELHGNSSRLVCLKCNLWNGSDNFFIDDRYDYFDNDNRRIENNKYMLKDFDEIVPICKKCGSVLKPDISLFFEGVNDFGVARDWIVDADLLVVAGCSLKVGPANELPLYLNWGKYTIDENDNIVFNDSENISRSIWVNNELPPEGYEFDYEFIMPIDTFAKLINFTF